MPTEPLLAWALGWKAPIVIDQIEWFASASDIGRLMDYLRARNDPQALEIMAINPGLSIKDPPRAYTGYKGGSEPGVISLNWRLKDSGGAWYSFSATWNDAAAAVDDDKFIALVQEALDLFVPPAVLTTAGRSEAWPLAGREPALGRARVP